MNTINQLPCFTEAARKFEERSDIARQVLANLELEVRRATLERMGADPDLWYMRHAEQARYQRALDEQIQRQSLRAFRGHP